MVIKHVSRESKTGERKHGVGPEAGELYKQMSSNLNWF